MVERNTKALLVKPRWVAGVMSLCLFSFCSLLSCGELCAVLPDGSCWKAPIGCTTPWGLAGPAPGAAKMKQISDFPSDTDWINVSGNGDADHPLVITGSGVITKMVRIREGSSYVILDGLTIRPEPSKDYAWGGSDVFIEGGTHHIAVRNCTLKSANDADPTAASRFRTLLSTNPSQGRNVEYVTVYNCTVGPLGDWTQNDGTDHGGLMFPAGTKYVRVFDCTISDIGGDAIGLPNETMFADRGGVDFPATDIQIGRCHLQRCKENLIDGKLVQGIIISECILEKTNAFSTSSRGDAVDITVGTDGILQQIINDHGGTIQWMSPDNAWLLFNDIRDLSRGAIFTAASFTPADRNGTMYSVGNTWTNINAAGRGSGTGLIAGNGNKVLSFNDTFTNVDQDTSMVVFQEQIPQAAFRQEFGRDLEQKP